MTNADRSMPRALDHGTALLVLEDGTLFEGASHGAIGEAGGEVVFNTSMTGYQEILTDPSYHGQLVAMTYPQIGNYGVNAADAESSKPHVRGFIAREFSRVTSSHRAEAPSSLGPDRVACSSCRGAPAMPRVSRRLSERARHR